MSFYRKNLKKCPICNELKHENFINCGQCLNCNYFDEDEQDRFNIKNYFNFMKRIRSEEYILNLTGEFL